MRTQKEFIDFCDLVHEQAKSWWVEPINRNTGELIALIHSEVSEAWNAYAVGLMDDNLPHRQGVEVKVADVMIRLGYFIVGKGLSPADVWRERPREKVKASVIRLIDMHSGLSKCLEGYRKSDNEDIIKGLSIVLLESLCVCNNLSLDIDEAIKEKMEYNVKRADHKLKGTGK